MTTIDVDITFDTTTKKFKATVSNVKASGKRSDIVRWKFTRKDSFPNKAPVILQFVGNAKAPISGPFDDADTTLGRYQTTGNSLFGLVTTCASGPFSYTLAWIDGTTEKELLDPELIIDGDAKILTKFRQGLRSALSRLRQADRLRLSSAAKAKAAAKAKKAKRAPKKNAKSKAKKR